MASSTHKQVNLQISHIAASGYGIGTFVAANSDIPRLVEVPFSAPGDILSVELGSKRAGLYRANIREVISPSPYRELPRCIHFGACGGCLWQQLPYEQQLAIKQQAIYDRFIPALGSDILLHPIIPCTPPWHYRNKMEFSFSSDKAGRCFLGLCLHGGRGKVFHLSECHLVRPWMVAALSSVRKWWEETGLQAYRHRTNSGSLRTLTLREGMRSEDRMAILTVSGNPDYALQGWQLEMLVAFLREAMESSTPGSRLSIFLSIQQIAKGRPTNFFEMLLHGEDHIRETLYIATAPHIDPIPLTFAISPSAFFQPNSFQAEKLYSAALHLAKLTPDDIVYDLYCGTGTLGICAAKSAGQIIGVEITPEAALDARTNVTANQLSNVTIFTADVAQLLSERVGNLPAPTVVLVDPPRAGLSDKAIDELIALAPRTIVYISCNPVTQAANGVLLIKGGYYLAVLQPVDQFPHTVHIENIAVFHRNE